MPDTDRYPAVTLALAVYRAILRRRRTVDEIATEIDAPPQTVRRLIAALQVAGIDIDARRRKAKSAGQPPYEYRASRV